MGNHVSLKVQPAPAAPVKPANPRVQRQMTPQPSPHQQSQQQPQTQQEELFQTALAATITQVNK